MRYGALTFLLLAARPIIAQTPPARAGFWWGFGIGYGTYEHTCDRCDRPTGTTGVSSGYLALGAAVSPQLTLGIEFSGGTTRQNAGVMSASLIGIWYPQAAGGPFLRCGIGTSTYRQASYAEFPPFTGTGTGWLVAVGWDVRVERGPSFTPMLSYRAGTPGTVVAYSDTAATNLRQRSVAFTLGLTFH